MPRQCLWHSFPLCLSLHSFAFPFAFSFPPSLLLLTHSTDRVTQVQLLADGSMTFISDSTMAVDVKGSWRPAEGGKVGFLMERFYATNADSKYSMIRLYEGVITVSDKSIRGEGKIEQEKYDSLFPCGFFSLISVDDGPDDFFEKLAPGHTVMKGVDQ